MASGYSKHVWDILMDGMSTLWSGGHIVVLGRLLHRFFRILPGTLGFWWEMGRESILPGTFVVKSIS